MRVLLVNLAAGDTDFIDKGRVWRSIYRRPYLGLQYLSAYLKQHGHDVDLIDCQVEDLPPRELAARARAGGYGLVGFFAIYVNREQLLACVGEIRRAVGVPVVVGGPDCFNDEAYLRAGVDLVVRGEGELTLLELVERLERGAPLDDVLGLSRLVGGELVRNADRPFITDIDSLPFPDRSHYPITVWHDYMDFNMRKPFATLITSRGCPYGCEFCDSPSLWQRRVRQRSPANVLAEIDALVTENGVRYLLFSDDIFGISFEWQKEFCEALAARRYDLGYFCLIHPLVYGQHAEERMDLLARSGCRTFHLGVQSASEDVLRISGRFPGELKHHRRIVELARARGILSFTTFIHGLPGDTREGFAESRAFVKDMSPDYALFLPLKVFAGSTLERKLERGERELPGFTWEELVRECRRSELEFYRDPRRTLRLFLYVLRHNPRWLVTRGWYAVYMIVRTLWIGLLPAARPQDRDSATLPALSPGSA